MYIIFLSLISICICYKFGDWKNWREYYATILFFILSSVACAFITYDQPLWLYESVVINHTFTDLFITITVYPCTILMFIPHLPRKMSKAILHIAIYVAVYTIPELIAVKLGCFTYDNGWNIWYSFIFNCIMFPILILHHKKPLYAWSIAIISPHILFFLLKIPYGAIR